MAQEALVRCDGLSGLARWLRRGSWRRMPGVGPARAAQLDGRLRAGTSGRRSTGPPGAGPSAGPRDLAERLVAELGHLEREELRVVLLDTRNGVLAMPTVYVGNVSVALVRIGELFRDAVRLHAARLILVHNHPSGDPTPSPDDLHLTAEAVAAGRLLDIAVLDHLVIGHGAFVSLRDRGVAFDAGLASAPGLATGRADRRRDGRADAQVGVPARMDWTLTGALRRLTARRRQ